MKTSRFFRHLVLGMCICALTASAGCGSDTGDQDDVLSDPDCSPTLTLSDPITEDTTLSADDSACLRVTDVIEVSAHLTIEPGVVLKFEEDAGLNVEGGTLTAEATDEHPIIMTGTQSTAGFWKGLQYRGTDSAENALDHVVIEYAGGSAFDGAAAAGLVINSTGIYGEPVRVAIDNTTVRHSADRGLYLESDTTIVSFTNNVFTENAGSAAQVSVSMLDALADSSSFAGNGDDYIHVTEGTVDTGDHIWSAKDVPYHFSGAIEIAGDAFVQIAAGATLEFESNIGGINVEGGKLAAVGTNDAKVTFRGEEDLDNFWRGIQYRDTVSEDNSLEHVVIANAAADNFRGAGTAALVLNSSGINGEPVRLSLDNVEINKFAAEAAVYVEPDTALGTCSGLTGFAAADVTGDGNAAFIANCGL